MATLKLVIANKAYSSWSLRPWLLMTHLGIPFEEERIPLHEPDTRERILRHSPAGRVPVLIDDGFAVWDSLAIVEYLAEKFPGRSIWPAEAHARARARSISAEMHSGFMNLRGQMPMNVRRRIPGRTPTPETAAEITRIQAMWSECRNQHAGSGPFLFGGFSAADAMFAPVVTRFATYGVALSGAAKAYADTMSGLPALQAWVGGAHAESEVIAHYET